MHGYWAQFAAIAVAHLLAVACPGPDFAMVLRQSLAHGRRAAIWTSIGIGTAILLHVTYAVLGIGILLRASHFWFTAVKFLGAAYLAWIGVKALRTRPRRELSGAPPGAEPDLARPEEPTWSEPPPALPNESTGAAGEELIHVVVDEELLTSAQAAGAKPVGKSTYEEDEQTMIKAFPSRPPPPASPERPPFRSPPRR